MRRKSQIHNAIHGALIASMGLAFVGCQSLPNATLDEMSGGGRRNGGLPGQTGGAPGAGAATSPDQSGGAATSGAVAGATGAGGDAAGAAAGAQQAAPTFKPDATVKGRVVDVAGNPVTDLQVNGYEGVRTFTDADGRFSLGVYSRNELRLDFSKPGFLDRQVMVSLKEGDTREVEVTVKPLDAKVTPIIASMGGVAVSSDGKAQLRVPPGALTGDSNVRLTWMDPMPSDAFPYAHGELPGPLLTRAMADGGQADEEFTIPPLSFTLVDLETAKIAPGQQLELRMRINPEALKLAGDNIDFNNPATLQQPCYDFDRGIGLWVNPATARLERDADGTAWTVYTMHSRGTVPNFFNLLQTVSTGSHVSTTNTINWQESVSYQEQVWDRIQVARRVPRTVREYVTWNERIQVQERYNPGNGWRTRTVTRNVRRGEWRERTVWDTVQVWEDVSRWVTRTRLENRSRTENVYGLNFAGRVREASSNSALNGRPLAGATVQHDQDFFGGSTKTTDGSGAFTIPMWHNSAAPGIWGADFFDAGASSAGWDMSINTDSRLAIGPAGPDFSRNNYGEVFRLDYRIDGVLRSENVTFPGMRFWTFSRDARDNQNNFELVGLSNPTFVYVPEASLPTASLRPGGQDGLGLRVYNRPANTGLVTERSSNTALNGRPLVGATVSHNADFYGATTKTTGADGRFTIPYFNALTRVSGASFFDAFGTGGFNLVVDTDARVRLRLTGDFDPTANSAEQFALKYRVDGREVTENVTFSPDRTLVFGRDSGDNFTNFELISLQNAIFRFEPQGGMPTANVRPGGTAVIEAPVQFVAVK
ncbi:MAG: carboxypeptidase-like regulatory domain-containing protein [Candidatus Sericytochromatia bacterium]|nr:carboxypeptidase-like regulatory domain-containing protein [Candidatus Sericytochromatia bacterium]